jgi:DNA-binding SARP family transcriptional activator
VRRLFGDAAVKRSRGMFLLDLPVTDLGRRVSEITAQAMTRAAALEQGPGRASRAYAAEATAIVALVDEALAILAEGPFLQWCESQWAAELRSSYRSDGQQLGLLGARLMDTLGRRDDVARLCRLVIALDRYDERGWACLVEHKLRQGLPPEAIAIYHEYEALIREELAAEPSADLQRLVRPLLERQRA